MQTNVRRGMRILGPMIVLAAVVLLPGAAHAVCTWPRVSYVALRASNGRFLAVEGGGGRSLVATSAAVGPWEKFKIATFDGSPPGQGKRVSLQGWGGQFVVAEPGAILKNNRNTVGDWETFILEITRAPRFGDCSSRIEVRLKTTRGAYISAVGGGGGNLVSDVTTPGPSETFEMRAQPGGLDLDDAILSRVNSPGQGNTRWRRADAVDGCSSGFSGVSAASDGIVLSMSCDNSLLNGKVEAEAFQNTELKNGWHITAFEVNRGTNGVTDGIVVLDHPADLPVGDIRPYMKFTAECPARSTCGFTVMIHVRGPRRDPKF